MADAPRGRSPARSSGVLLHPTSLPGPFGIGDLGPAARAWIDALARARQQWWQILPLGPTAYGDSPYQCFSAFAGNPYLVSPERLLQDGLLDAADVAGVAFPADHVDYGPVIEFKVRILDRAWDNFQAGRASWMREPFERFQREKAGWLEDYALFMTLKDVCGGQTWHDWPAELRQRDPAALARAREEHAEPCRRHQFRQFLFFRQWWELRHYARERGIRIIGDAPIFVAIDSADVWAQPHLFWLDERRRPTVVAGVPPDYFSRTGQLWGNPLYDWTALKRTGYAWWIDRLRALIELVDLVRLDHFRGFEAYWEVPAGHPTAEVGRWVKGPDAELLDTLRTAFGSLPIIAEDLGLITAEVEALRDRFNLPGMRILQFAFSGEPHHPYLPHNFVRSTVVYTGTHDNDTTRGWYNALGDAERDRVRRYLARDGSDITWDLIRLAWSSVADYAVVPLQDLLDLDTAARMNTPGRAVGNWAWRFTDVPHAVLDRLADLTMLYGRAADGGH
jgi:4-alpha-glucanotransferase